MWTAKTVLVCALTLLSRPPSSLPPIQLLERVPPDVSRQAEAFVRQNDPQIYLVTSSTAFALARRALYRCGNELALRKIASVIVHEEWHLKHGSDETGAYQAQLTTLAALGDGPGSPLYYEVSRAMRTVLAERDRRTARADALMDGGS